MTEMRFGADKLVISEIFGPTFQGEGPSIGRQCVFLRLGHCNLQCSWCDTSYTWDWNRYSQDDELSTLGVADIAARIEQASAPMLVISGGEPMLQQAGLISLFAHLPSTMNIEIETNGTIAPSAAFAQRVSRFNVSPKLGHASMSSQRRIRPHALQALVDTGKASFKFVASTASDLAEIDSIAQKVALPDIYVMPEGRDPDQIIQRMRELAPEVLARNWNLTTRLHVLLWGDLRGV